MNTECLYDICNYYGDNGGAWADLVGDDIIVFSGCWWGDYGRAPTNFMPGVFRFDLDILADKEEFGREDDERTVWNPNARVHHGSVDFAVRGNIQPLIDRFRNDEKPQPEELPIAYKNIMLKI